jgi:hypothetical protein
MSFDRFGALALRLSSACDVFRSLAGAVASRANTGRWRSGSSAAGRSSGGVPLGSVQGQIGGIALGGVLVDGGIVQLAYGPVAHGVTR